MTTAVKAGFLNSAKGTLYPEGGSREGHLTDEAKKKREEHIQQEEMNKKMNGAKGPQVPDEDARPSWYTAEWPSACQYNNPGCKLDPLQTSDHESALHAKVVQESARFKAVLDNDSAPFEKELRLGFLSLTDAEVKLLLSRAAPGALTSALFDNVEVLDLGYNNIQDGGVQLLAAALAGGAFPKLKEIKLYHNQWSEAGKMMLTGGCAVLRPEVKLTIEDISV